MSDFQADQPIPDPASQKSGKDDTSIVPDLTGDPLNENDTTDDEGHPVENPSG